MRKIWKYGLTFVMSLTLGLVGNFGVCSNYICSAAEALDEMSSAAKAVVSRIDILDYESNASAVEFVINNIAGMEKLAELVNNGTEDFYGKTVTLMADLKYDKTIENNYEIIGDYDHEFNGIFDGDYHTISGINLNSDARIAGLFGSAGENAKLSRIILENSSIILQDNYAGGGIRSVGGIVGYNKAAIYACISGHNVEITGGVSINTGGIVGHFDHDAVITKCINFSKVHSKKGYVGGIVGLVEEDIGQIKQCINYGEVFGEFSEDGRGAYHIGGIGGECGTYIECCNMGKVISNENNHLGLRSIGGIAGIWARTVNCYNAGQVIIDSDDLSAGWYRRHGGGIIGVVAVPSLSIENCYSVGKVENGRSGAITSIYNKYTCELSNCYWLTSSTDIGVCMDSAESDNKQDTSSVFEYTQAQMQAQAFVDEMNANSKALGCGEVWAADIKNINNGYPILKNVPYSIEDLKNSLDDNNNDDNDEPIDTTQVDHYYEDYNYNNKATNSTIRIYANGAAVTDLSSGEKKNYKSCTLFTNITASYRYTVDKKGTVKPSTGKVIVGVTSSNTEPTLVKGRIVDKDAAKIASASIKSGQITVTAKTQPGRVYLWVMDTGRAAESACIPVTVIAAPTATNLYAVPNTDTSFTYGKTKQFKSGKVNVGESIKVYLYPTYKQNGTVRRVNNVSYTASVDAKSSDYFSVSQSAGNPLCFEISAKGLKDGKSVSGRITFTCGLNGRKTVFTATATNQVTGISEGNVSGLTKTADHCFRIMVSDAAKTTGTFEMQTECVSNAEAGTDSLKFYAMGSADGYDAAKLAEGTVKITKKKSAAQGKISMKLEKDKKTVTVTAAKGTKPVMAYFLAVYNTVDSGDRKGYEVISVTAE